jgi:hypothetical protein
MPQRFDIGDKVSLRVSKSFNNPTQTLEAGSKGTVIQKFSIGNRYRIQFDQRPSKTSIIGDSDLV